MGQDKSIVAPEELKGTFVGNGCILTPECIKLDISPACGGGICVIKYFTFWCVFKVCSPHNDFVIAFISIHLSVAARSRSNAST